MSPSPAEEDGTATEDGAGEPEQEAAVSLDIDAERAEVGSNSAEHKQHPEGSAKHDGPRQEEQDDGQEFCGGYAQPAIRFGPKGLKDVDAFRGPGEFEVQGLQENDSGDDPQDPVNGFHSGCLGEFRKFP